MSTTHKTTAETFAVGDRVHYNGWTDVYPATVVKVTPTTVTVRQDNFRKDPEWKMDWVDGGFAGHVTNNYQQKNVIEPDEGGTRFVKFTLRAKRGEFVQVGYSSTGPRSTLHQGWDAFYDYNF